LQVNDQGFLYSDHILAVPVVLECVIFILCHNTITP